MTKIINFHGGPCSGKSRTASRLFSEMKVAGYRVELINEYAKELTYEQSSKLFCQPAVYGEQLWRQQRLYNEVDYIITDSPIITGIVYSATETLASEILREFGTQNNINILLVRQGPYEKYGRTQTEEEAKVLDSRIKEVLCITGEKYTEVTSDQFMSNWKSWL